ncbi:MAG: guanylate kinase [Alphaproteobacteria bacterium]
MSIPRRGLMFVLSSPSGAGKTAIARHLLKMDDQIALSVSVTTRPMRSGETDGVDYSFVDEAAFERMIAEDAFIEHATVFNNSYGTPREPVMAGLAAGRDILFDVDWQGAQELRNRMPGDQVSVFILPPSMAELERRLTDRDQDSADVVASRMARAANEISHWGEYDYVVVNRELECAAASVLGILQAERLHRERQTGLVDFVKGLT